QVAHNEKHGITPETVKKAVRDVIEVAPKAAEVKSVYEVGFDPSKLGRREREKLIEALRKEMKEAAKRLEFERAADLRDAITEIEQSGTAGKGKPRVAEGRPE
ncbi:MAG: UvrB/UvrC motif-containing protein, partial [Bacillota bacterium]